MRKRNLKREAIKSANAYRPWITTMAVLTLLAFVSLEVSKDVHYAVYHQPHLPFGIGTSDHHYCNQAHSCEPGKEREQTVKPWKICPFEHVKFPPFQLTIAVYFQVKSISAPGYRLKVTDRLIIRRMAFDHLLRAPPLC